MRRAFSTRIAMLVLVAFVTTAPAFAAPRGDDSAIGSFERAISRVVKSIRHIFDMGFEGAPPK